MTRDDEPSDDDNTTIGVKSVAAVALFLGALGTLLALGTWQAGKFLDKRPRFQQMEERLDRPPVEFRSASRLGDDSVDFRRARLVGGSFDRKHSVLIGEQFDRGRPGFWVLTPYVFADGTSVFVKRGWVPNENPRELVRETEAPENPVVGIVYPPYAPPEIEDSADSDPFGRRKLPVVSSLDLEYLHESLPTPGPGRTALIVLGDEFAKDWEPRYPKPSAEHVTDPYLTPGKHLTYTVLWYGCAALLVWLFWAGVTGRLDPQARH